MSTAKYANETDEVPEGPISGVLGHSERVLCDISDLLARLDKGLNRLLGDTPIPMQKIGGEIVGGPAPQPSALDRMNLIASKLETVREMLREKSDRLSGAL